MSKKTAKILFYCILVFQGLIVLYVIPTWIIAFLAIVFLFLHIGFKILE